MIWAILCINLLTIVIAFKKRMALYGLLNAIFLFLVTGQAFQIENDLSTQRTVRYLNNFISDVGFANALWYVLGISCISLLLAIIAKGYRAFSQVPTRYSFQPPSLFYLCLFAVQGILSVVLIFVVVGLSEFLHASRPGVQSGTTIVIALLFLGIMPLLLKILYRSKITRGDVACFLFSFFVTAGFSRIHLMLYLAALLLAYFYASGWSDRPISPKLVTQVLFFGGIAFALFFGIGALHDAQNFVTGSPSDLIDYIVTHPEKSVLSIEYNYRVGVEGMSGIAGAFSQYLSNPNLVHFDFGASWMLQGLVQWLPGPLKARIAGITELSNDLNWFSSSVVATGPESYFVSFGWWGIVLYPLTLFFLSWYLPMRVLALELAPVVRLAAYTLFACYIFFVRGSLFVWMGISISYIIIILTFWPFFKPYVRARAIANSDGSSFLKRPENWE
jgi:hypothetical protein